MLFRSGLGGLLKPLIGLPPRNRVEECGEEGDLLDSSVLAPSQGHRAVSRPVGPRQSGALLVPPGSSHASSFTDHRHRRPPSGRGRLAWPSTRPVQGPACCSLCERMPPGRPQAPYPSDPRSSLPVAALCCPAGTVLGAGHCIVCKRTRRAREMLTWPCPQPHPFSSSLSAIRVVSSAYLNMIRLIITT